MQRDPLPRARAVAQLLIINAYSYANERDKDPAPYRFSSLTLRYIAGRSRIRQAFIDDLFDELRGFGWLLIVLDETEFAVMPIVRTSVWAKLGSKRVRDLAAKNDEDAISLRFFDEVELYQPPDDDL